MKRQTIRSKLVGGIVGAATVLALLLVTNQEARGQNTLFPNVRPVNQPTTIIVYDTYVEMFGQRPFNVLPSGYPQPVPVTRFGYPDQYIQFNSRWGEEIYYRNSGWLDPAGVYYNQYHF